MSNKKTSQVSLHKMPVDLQNKLLADDVAMKLWQDITPLAQNEFICWVESAKKPATRNRRIERTSVELKEGKRRPCCWAGCQHRKN